MLSEAVLKALTDIVPKENIHLNEPLSGHTTFRVGGPADCLVEMENTKQLKHVQRYLRLVGVPFTVLGNGSNILAGDKGYRGAVLQIRDKMAGVRVEGLKITAQAGALLSATAKTAQEHGLAGMEFASGIPGTVGGAVVMNAGAYGGEMSQIVDTVTVLDQEGEELVLDNGTMEFGYRTSVIKQRPFLVTEVAMKLAPGDPAAIRDRMEELTKRRREKQPLEYPSAGSTFKRPEGYFAGELIMRAGMRGASVGGARVSDKHCGFIVNAGGASAADIRSLIGKVRREVSEQFGVELEPEIVMLGEF